MFPLLGLPAEIVLPIVEAVDDRNDLIALAQTCKTLRDAAEAQLFNTIEIHDGDEAQSLATVLNARPDRFTFVQKLAVTPHTEDWDGIQTMPSLVRQMNNLRWLQVENPLINTFRYGNEWEETCVEEYMQCFREEDDQERPLRNLRSFTFHSRGFKHRFYHVRVITPIFSSRFLKHVHVSCVHIDEVQIPAADVGKAAIESLHLDECNINATALSSLLNLPRNLKTLVIDENCYHLSARDTRCPALNKQLDVLMEALSRQQHSLQRLRHVCRFRNRPGRSKSDIRESTKTGFSNFEALKTIELADASGLTEYLTIPELAPPNVDTLILANIDWEITKLWERLEETIMAIMPSMPLKSLELHFEPTSYRIPQVLSTALTHRPSRPLPRSEKLIQLARVLKEANIPVTAIGYQKGNCIPPYLYADSAGFGGRPKPGLLFCSERLWAEEEKYKKLVAEGHKGTIEKEDDGMTAAAKILTGYFESPQRSSE